MSVRKWSWPLGLLACLVGSTTLGCDAEKHEAKLESKMVAAQAETGVRRCGDFINAKEASELGLESYQPNRGDANPKRGVVCSTHPLVISLHQGDQYPKMLAGAKALQGMKVLEGPTLGSEVFWYETADAKQVMLKTKSGNYAIGVSGPSRELVEKAARLAAQDR